MLSVPYPGSRNKTAEQCLDDYLRKTGKWTKTHHAFSVHRLDRDTSGVMMFALNEKMQKIIMDTWHTMVVERMYISVSENPTNPKIPLLPDYGLIDAPLAFNAYHVGFVPKKGDFPSNKYNNSNYVDNTKRNLNNFDTVNARTHFKVLERGKFYTMFELHLDTGKKNQIRAHLASKGYPLAGDENYRAKSNPFGRLALHARTLAFIHPITKEKLKFEQPEDKEWLETVKFTFKNTAPAIWCNFSNHHVQVEKDLSKIHFKSTSYANKQKRKMDFIQKGKTFNK